MKDTAVLIRDLSDEEFFNSYKCDRFTAMVISNRLRYVVQHMCTDLLNTAFSIILRDWYDFAATISGPPEQDYPMPAVSNSLVLFVGPMTDAVRNMVEEYGADSLKPGDVLIANDPYRIGTHVNDICFVKPVFYEVNGENKIVGFVNMQAHMLDMGGIVPSGFSGTKKDIYENGLVLSPRLLYKEGKPHKPTWDIIFDNARYGEIMRPDMITIYKNLLLGEKETIETIDRYGLDAYLGAIKYAIDISAESMGRAFEKLPDGIYEAEEFIDCDGIDNNEEFKVKTKVTVRGGKVEVDLSGSSRQARTSINASFLDTKTAVGAAFKYLLDPSSSFTSGVMRDIDIVLPDASVAHAMPPDGAIFLYWETSMPILLSIFRALKDVLEENAIAGDTCSLNIHNANGVWQDGNPWVTMAQCGGEHGAWGATKAGDADSYSVAYLANNLDPSTEAIEIDVPVVVLRKEYVPDTAGAGMNRGGAGVLKDTLWRTSTEHHSMPLHLKRPSGFGVYGGKDGRTGAVWTWDPESFNIEKEGKLLGNNRAAYSASTPVAGKLNDENMPCKDGEYYYFANVPVWKTKPNAIFRYITNAGGGWGNPYHRDPEKVKRDVRDEYVTIEGAKNMYGVVIIGDPIIDPEGLAVDYRATYELRKSLKQRE